MDSVTQESAMLFAPMSPRNNPETQFINCLQIILRIWHRENFYTWKVILFMDSVTQESAMLFAPTELINMLPLNNPEAQKLINCMQIILRIWHRENYYTTKKTRQSVLFLSAPLCHFYLLFSEGIEYWLLGLFHFHFLSSRSKFHSDYKICLSSKQPCGRAEQINSVNGSNW